MGVIDMVNGRLCETLPIEEIEQIRTEAIKGFAKWLEQNGYLSTIEHDEDEDSEGFIVYHEYVTSMKAEDVCEEYFKEQSNEQSV